MCTIVHVKKLADICFMINIEDTHIVSYALKKLVSMELVQTGKRSKEVVFLRPNLVKITSSATVKCAKSAWWRPFQKTALRTPRWANWLASCGCCLACMTRQRAQQPPYKRDF